MRVLVTGHKGYIGSVMVPILLEEGYDVVGMDVDLYRRSTFGTGMVEIEEMHKDVRDVEPADLEGIDQVFHLAALSNDPLSDLNAELTYAINHHGSVRLAKAAKAAGVERFIFSSSCSNYGAGDDSFRVETSEVNPVSAYGISKVRVEEDVAPLADGSFSPVFLRNATAYGASPRLRFDILVNNLVAWALTTKQVRMRSDGTAWRPLIHIRDITRGFIAASRAPREVIHNAVFNVGSTTENFTVREVAAYVKKMIPGSEITFGEGAGSDPRNYRVDFTKIAKALPDFKPQWTVERGVAELLEAYERVGITVEDFEGIRYKRIAQLQDLLSMGALSDELRWQQAVPA